MTNVTDADREAAIAWAEKVSKASGTSYTPASRSAARFILSREEATRELVETLGFMFNEFGGHMSIPDYNRIADLIVKHTGGE